MYKSIIGCVSILLISSLLFAEEQLGIAQIYDQFVITSAASSKCIKPDPEELKSFMSNFKMVAIHLGQTLEEQNPDKTREYLLAVMKQRNVDLTNKVFDLVKERGCEDKDVQQIVQRFYVQAKWQLGK